MAIYHELKVGFNKKKCTTISQYKQSELESTKSANVLGFL